MNIAFEKYILHEEPFVIGIYFSGTESGKLSSGLSTQVGARGIDDFVKGLEEKAIIFDSWNIDQVLSASVRQPNGEVIKVKSRIPINYARTPDELQQISNSRQRMASGPVEAEGYNLYGTVQGQSVFISLNDAYDGSRIGTGTSFIASDELSPWEITFTIGDILEETFGPTRKIQLAIPNLEIFHH